MKSEDLDAEVSRFRKLKDRPTPELDSDRLWAAIAAELPPRARQAGRATAAGGGERGFPALRAALAAGVAVAMVAAAVGLLLRGDSVEVPAVEGSGPSGRVATGPPAGVGDQGLVWLRPREPQPPQEPAAGGTLASESGPALRLHIRLVRGYDETPPEEVAVEPQLGVGGTDAIADVRADISRLLPFREFGLVAEWEGLLSADAVNEISLDDYSLGFVSTRMSVAGRSEPVFELRDVRFGGASVELTAARLRLVPDQTPYLLGVLEQGQDVPSLILVVEARLADNPTAPRR